MRQEVGRPQPVAKQPGDPLVLDVVLMLSDLLALKSLAVEIATQHKSVIILDLVPVEAEEGMLNLEITDLQDAIDLGMEAGRLLANASSVSDRARYSNRCASLKSSRPYKASCSAFDNTAKRSLLALIVTTLHAVLTNRPARVFRSKWFV